jgi:hypothetical protein
MNAATRRLRLTQMLSRVQAAVPDDENRREVYDALYPILRSFDCDAVLDLTDIDPAYDAVLRDHESWLFCDREIEA